MAEYIDTSGDKRSALGNNIESAYKDIGITKAHKQIVLMILLGVFFDALEQNAVGITGPLLREYWGLGSAEVGFLNTATFTATAFGRLLTGLVMDRYGRRFMLMVNLLIFTLGSLICAIAPDYYTLLIGRFIVGLGLGGEIAVAVIMMAEFFSATHRGVAVGLINITAAGLGNMLAPAFGLIVFAIFTGPERWRWVYFLLFLPALMVMYFRRYIPESPRYLASTGRFDEANIVLTRLATGQLSGKVTKIRPYLPGADAMVVQTSTAIEPGLWRKVFQGKLLSRTVLLSIAVCMSYAAQISMLTLMPTILVFNGYEVNKSLWFTLIMQSGSLLGAITAATLAGRFSRKKVLTFASILGCAAGLSMAMFANEIVLIIIFGVFFNFSVIILNTTIWLFAPELYPTRVRGFGTSIILAMGSLSGGLFPLISGVVFDHAGLEGMFSMLAMLFVVLGISVQFPPETFGKPMEEE